MSVRPTPFRLARAVGFSLLVVSSLSACALDQTLQGLSLSTLSPVNAAETKTAVTRTPAMPKLSKESKEGLKLARLLRDQGKVRAALDIYARLDERGDLKGPLLLEYASVAAVIQSPQVAQSLYKRAQADMTRDGAVLTDTQTAAISVGMGRANLALSHPGAAAEDFQRALKADPKLVSAMNGLGIALDAQGERDQAQGLFSQALERDPSDIPTINNLALSYLASGKTDQAIALLSQPEVRQNATAVLNLAMAHVMNDDVPSARRLLSQSIDDEKVDAILTDLVQRRAHIARGANPASEFLAASHQMLALKDPES